MKGKLGWLFHWKCGSTTAIYQMSWINGRKSWKRTEITESDEEMTGKLGDVPNIYRILTENNWKVARSTEISSYLYSIQVFLIRIQSFSNTCWFNSTRIMGRRPININLLLQFDRKILNSWVRSSLPLGRLDRTVEFNICRSKREIEKEEKQEKWKTWTKSSISQINWTFWLKRCPKISIPIHCLFSYFWNLLFLCSIIFQLDPICKGSIRMGSQNEIPILGHYMSHLRMRWYHPISDGMSHSIIRWDVSSHPKTRWDISY